MKRIIVIVLLLLICCMSVSCDKEEKSDGEQQSTDKGKKEEPSNTPIPQARYFGNRLVQYDEENACHQILWGFSETENGETIRQNATIHLVITNDNGEQVYKKNHKVTEANYSVWNSNLMGSKLLGCIYVKDSEITPGSTEKGVLTISAELSNGSYWKEDTLKISNLPVKPLQLSLPTLPLTVTKYKYSGGVSTKVEVQKITYEYDRRLTFSLTVKMIENAKGNDSMDYCDITYKLKDSKGVIVSSGTWLVGQMSVGDTIVENETVYVDLDLNESYVLELFDYKP